MVYLILSNKNFSLFSVLLFIVALVSTACAPYQARRKPIHYNASGDASWYGPGFHGKRTASGERYNQRAMTAAHKTLPFGTMLKVTNSDNGKSVVVRINDRGPFVRGRIVDLSKSAAERIGMMGPGVARVELAAVSGHKSQDERDIRPPKKAKKHFKPKRFAPPQPPEQDKNFSQEDDSMDASGVAALISAESGGTEDNFGTSQEVDEDETQGEEF